MSTRAVSLLLCLAVAWRALAAQAPTHTVSGVVFDSVAGVPLAGAIVQIALPDSARRTFSTITDSTGHYRIGGLPSGRFAIGFQHIALDALGLESPLNAFELGTDTSLTVDLAIPSGDVVRAQRCGKTAVDVSAGMLAGFVLDARRGTTVGGAVVAVQWLELVRTNGKFGGASQTVTATVGPDGTYLACGVPGDAWLTVHVAFPGYRVIDGHTAVPQGGATRLDLRLADSGVVRGTAALSGLVLREDRMPLASGRATIAALAVEAPIRDGSFSMSGLPAGTWDVEARAIGYEPHSVLVQLTERANASALITITPKVQTLETVSIVGKPSRDLKVLADIHQRSLTSFGTAFLPGNSWLQSANLPGDVLRAARGFRVKSPTEMYATGCGDQQKPIAETDPMATRIKPGKPGVKHTADKGLAIYLDGFRFYQGLTQLQNQIPMSQILAIEAYPDVRTAPPQWRTNDACAVMAVWSKR